MNLLDFIFPKRCVSCRKVGKYFCDICTAKIKFITYQICPVCEKAAIDGVTHPRCETRYTLDGLTAFFQYDGPIRQAVKLLKYRFVSDLATEFTDLIPTSSFQPITHNLQPTTLIPIPLHPSRLRFRGFNQADVLGRLLVKKLNSVRLEKFNPQPGGVEFSVSRTNPEHCGEGSYSISIRTDILKRVKKTIPQVEMKDRKKRLTNMESVFSVNQSANNNQSRRSGIHDAVFIHPSHTASGQSTIILFDDVFTTGATLRSAANILKRAGAKSVWGIVMAHG